MRLIEGAVVEPDGEDIEALHDEIRQLRDDLSAARRDASLAKREAARALSALRQQLGPLYKALQMVFGEIDAAGIEDIPQAGAARSTAWDEWKTRLGGGCAKVIDVLLLGGEMSITAIALTAKMGKRTVYQATSKMGQAGILVRNGSKFSLKKL